MQRLQDPTIFARAGLFFLAVCFMWGTAVTHADTPNNEDCDGDGLADAVEIQLGSDPEDADTDDDGVLDGAEPSAMGDEDHDGIPGVLDPDSDNDGLKDGTELGLDASGRHPDTDLSAGHFVPDEDPSTKTNPLSVDTDEGGIFDGAEDRNRNGRVDFGETDPNVPEDDPIGDSDQDGLTDLEESTIFSDPADIDSDDDGIIDGLEPAWNQDLDGDGLPSVLDADSDNDGILDGTELGQTQEGVIDRLNTFDPETKPEIFVPDADPSTTTDPQNPDTDNDGIPDGAEDPNHNGRIDEGETNPRVADRNIPPPLDSDGDGLTDAEERAHNSDPFDADTDDDGRIDGDEDNWTVDNDLDCAINVLDPDSDNDLLSDGLERGVNNTTRHPDTNTARGSFRPDLDPNTTTFPLRYDSDFGGISDGQEDDNLNGRIDPGDTDANFPFDDDIIEFVLSDTDGDSLSDLQEGFLGTDPNNPDSDLDGILDGLEVNAALDFDFDGAVNALDSDSDNDGILDGTEIGRRDLNLALPETPFPSFVDDEDPTTTTCPIAKDSDFNGIDDGAEDPNHDGAITPEEAQANPTDSDNDGLTDTEETLLGSDPFDADTDDDGLIDGDEDNWTVDTDLDTIPNVLDPDSDNDGLLDGLEAAITPNTLHPDTDTTRLPFSPDLDPSTTTSTILLDSDFGGIPDGTEDTNQDGRFDPNEIDPNIFNDDRNLLGQACTQGLGTCSVSDIWVLLDDTLVCGPPKPPSEEICDGLDNNCNGLIDDLLDCDRDSIPNPSDNCPNTPNTDQTNTDDIWSGDACQDRDGDSIPDLEDNCPDTPNPAQIDSDSNGVGAACQDPPETSSTPSTSSTPTTTSPPTSPSPPKDTACTCTQPSNQPTPTSPVYLAFAAFFILRSLRTKRPKHKRDRL